MHTHVIHFNNEFTVNVKHLSITVVHVNDQLILTIAVDHVICWYFYNYHIHKHSTFVSDFNNLLGKK